MKNILILHGALGSKKQFDGLLSTLSSQFSAHSLNFDGHGGVPGQNPFSIDLFTDNVVQYMRDNRLEKTHIFGYSMGGYVGLNLALKHPGLVDKLVTLGTKIDWTPEIAVKETALLDPVKIVEKVPHFAEHLNQLHRPNDWKEVATKTATMMSDMGNGKKLTNNHFSRIKHHILIGLGEHDRMVSRKESEHVAHALPHGELKIIEGQHHPIEKVDLHKLADVITSFLSLNPT